MRGVRQEVAEEGCVAEGVMQEVAECNVKSWQGSERMTCTWEVDLNC